MTVLPDIIKTGLKIVFCGSAVSAESARVRAYYAGHGNKFWEVLSTTGLTPCKLKPQQYDTLPEYGIGLTDIVKSQSGRDNDVSFLEFTAKSFRCKIEQFSPKVLAFNGKRAAQEFYGHKVGYGQQPERMGRTTAFVLPSTSAAARRYWDESYWREIAYFVGK